MSPLLDIVRAVEVLRTADEQVLADWWIELESHERETLTDLLAGPLRLELLIYAPV